MEGKKDFKFTVRSQSGKLIAQEITTFGSKANPFPEDWKNSGMALKAIFEHMQEFQNKYAPVTYEEGSELDPYPEVESVEKAAERFGKKTSYYSIAKHSFVEGALSLEAKAYWYDLFKKESNEK